MRLKCTALFLQPAPEFGIFHVDHLRKPRLRKSQIRVLRGDAKSHRRPTHHLDGSSNTHSRANASLLGHCLTLNSRQRYIQLQLFVNINVDIYSIRSNARCRPINGNRAASSGPWSMPVSTMRSGMNRDLPLRSVAAFTASVHCFPRRAVPGFGRQCGAGGLR